MVIGIYTNICFFERRNLPCVHPTPATGATVPFNMG